MTVRAAHRDDTNAAIRLLRDSRTGAGFDRPDGPTGFAFPFDPAYAATLFLNYLSGPQNLFCLVHDVDGTAQGVLLAHAYDYDFGPIRLAQERVWWIDPAHRGTAAWRMLDAYEAWAAEHRCAFAGMAGMGEDPVVMKLYARRGYRIAETHCLKAL